MSKVVYKTVSFPTKKHYYGDITAVFAKVICINIVHLLEIDSHKVLKFPEKNDFLESGITGITLVSNTTVCLGKCLAVM